MWLQIIYNRISAKMPMLAKWPISDFKKGATVSRVAEKHGMPTSLAFSVALVGKNDYG